MNDVNYRHTPDMGEISGFGGGYEETCQNMLHAGVMWVVANPGAEPTIRTLKNVTGMIYFEDDKAKELETVLLEAAKGDCTGAMMQTVVERLAYINAHGWGVYCEHLRQAEENKDLIEESEPMDGMSDEEARDFVEALKETFGEDAVHVIRMDGEDEDKPN